MVSSPSTHGSVWQRNASGPTGGTGPAPGLGLLAEPLGIGVFGVD